MTPFHRRLGIRGLAIGFIIVWLMIGTVVIAQQSTASVTVGRLEIEVGESSHIDVSVYCLPHCGAFDITLTYDPTVIRINNIEMGDYLNDKYGHVFIGDKTIEQQGGSIHVAAAALSEPYFFTSSRLFRLNVTGLSAGYANVQISSIAIGDQSGQLVPSPQSITNIQVVSEQPAAATPDPPRISVNIAAAASVRTRPMYQPNSHYIGNISNTSADVLSIFVDTQERVFLEIRYRSDTGWIMLAWNLGMSLNGDIRSIPPASDSQPLPPQPALVVITDEVRVSTVPLYQADIRFQQGFVSNLTTEVLSTFVDQQGRTFLEIRYGEGTGWIPFAPSPGMSIVGDLTSVPTANESSLTNSEARIIITKAVGVYTQPPNQSGFQLMGSISDTEVPILEVSTDSGGHTYLKIPFNDEEGWIWYTSWSEIQIVGSLDNVPSATPAPTPTASSPGALQSSGSGRPTATISGSISVRSRPSTGVSLLGTISNQIVAIRSIHVDTLGRTFLEISFDGIPGWILITDDSNVTVTGNLALVPNVRMLSESTSPTSAPENIGTAIVSAPLAANVRSGASTSALVLTSIPSRAQVDVIGYNTDRTWVHVRLDDGRYGWISAALLTIESVP